MVKEHKDAANKVQEFIKQSWKDHEKPKFHNWFKGFEMYETADEKM